ncbi:MAG: metallophosphoesterase, partial [Bosea sp. (in: a-proteobacteria)]
QKLTIAALADLHCGSVHMPLARIEEIVAATMALKPDVIVLLGDYICRETRNVHGLAPSQWAAVLAQLSAPLGVHAILGNHEYWDDPQVRRTRQGMPFAVAALEQAGIQVLANRAVRINAPAGAFWLAGLDSQIAFWIGPSRFIGRDDLTGTLAQISDDAPVILLAHEPDIFVDVPARVALTLSGHTHGGQVNVLGWSPYVPSSFGDRFRHGHVIEDGRHLIVSAGLGTSGPPMRFGVPPEILLIEMGTPGADRA